MHCSSGGVWQHGPVVTRPEYGQAGRQAVSALYTKGRAHYERCNALQSGILPIISLSSSIIAGLS